MLEAEPLAFFKFRWRRHGSQIDGALNSAAIAAHHWLRDLPASVSPHLCGKFSARTSRQTRPDERSPGAQGPQYHPLLLCPLKAEAGQPSLSATCPWGSGRRKTTSIGPEI